MNIIANLYIDEKFRSLKAFKEKYPGATIDYVDNRQVNATCVGCGKLIFEGDQCYVWRGQDETERTCMKCGGATADHKPEDA